ncbi:hypothetical protein PG994_002659 [Apiospora phragmitis]|uniref:Apple domain-containing protein n=1 Tax=Apiospora phragmitis TaxID=2905665 RepID=A0ABR1W5Z5_9PEZI
MWPTSILFVLNLGLVMAGALQQNGHCVNGTTIGSIQRFEVFCSSTAKGRRTASVDVPTLDDCADACASATPRCTAATFDGTSCAFHNETASLPLMAPDPNPKFTAVVGVPTGSSSNCRSIMQATTAQTINSVQFSLSCGTNLVGDSLSNHFASSLQDCMGQCAQTSVCDAVSFNADQTLGFQNCFLKSNASKPGFAVAPMLDSAMVVRHSDEPVADNNTETNIMIITAMSVSGFAFLLSLGLLSWWVHRKRKQRERFRSLPAGVMPVSYKDRMEKERMDRDRMDEKYGVRTSVGWSEMSREDFPSGEAEGVGRPTPVYEIRRKGESYHGGM